MPNDICDDSELVSYAFTAMQNDIDTLPLQYIFTSRRKYLELKLNITIIIDSLDDVPQGGAILTVSEDGNYYYIIVNTEDVDNSRDLVRLRIAHELGHIAHGHVGEMNYVINSRLGNATVPDSPYSQWRSLQEQEAEIFAANMLYAQGPVVERYIISEVEYSEVIGDIMLAPEQADDSISNSILNDSSLRLDIREALRINGYLSPPIPLLCHVLAEIFDNEMIENKHRNLVAQLIHKQYRPRLKNEERKPSDDQCIDCPDSLKERCKQSGSVSMN